MKRNTLQQMIAKHNAPYLSANPGVATNETVRHIGGCHALVSCIWGSTSPYGVCRHLSAGQVAFSWQPRVCYTILLSSA